MQRQSSNSVQLQSAAATKTSAVDCVDDERRSITFHIEQKPAASKCNVADGQSSSECPTGARSCLHHQHSDGAIATLLADERPDLRCKGHIHSVFQVNFLLTSVMNYISESEITSVEKTSPLGY